MDDLAVCWPMTWDEELQKYFTEVTAANDTILLGWDMADNDYIDHWTDIARQKDNSQSTLRPTSLPPINTSLAEKSASPAGIIPPQRRKTLPRKSYG